MDFQYFSLIFMKTSSVKTILDIPHLANCGTPYPTCEYKTNNVQSLAAHSKELHEKNLCKICNTITVGSAHRKDNDKTVHGTDTTHPTIIPRIQPIIKETIAQKKEWVQPPKNFHI